MPLTPIKLKAGIDRTNTDYSNRGGWYSCDKVRFRFGSPEKIGGWVKYPTTNQYLGSARALFNWVTLDDTNILAVGTNAKYYIETSGALYDVTPIRSTTTLGNNPFGTTNGATLVVVTHSSHGATSGDFVTFSGAVGFAGIASGALNAEFAVTVTSASTYTIVVATPANATTSGGGASVSAAFQISTTADVSVPGRGWNAGPWGRGAWNTPATSVTYSTLRLWSQESFGEDHVFCTRDGQIYYWKYSLGLNHRATLLSALVGASDTPLMATELLLSTNDRHLIAFGVNPVGSSIQDPLLIRWADTESLTQWTPSIINAAGDLRVSSGNRIVTAVRMKQEILVFTDGSIFSLQFVGAPEIFGVFPTADNVSIISPNAVAVAGNSAFWLGNDKFYVYSGRVETLPCLLEKYIFSDINRTQADQIFAGTNEGFSEIWWFYCSASSNEIDRYVVFNYDEHTWVYGTMNRSAWLDTPLRPYPLATNNGSIYMHENGVDDDRQAPINAWIESSDFDITDGNRYSFVTRVLPDVSFVGSSTASPSVTMTFTPRNFPGGAYKQGDAAVVSRSASVPIEQFTEKKSIRLRGRQMNIRIESNGLGTHWKLGTPRIDIQPDGGK